MSTEGKQQNLIIQKSQAQLMHYLPAATDPERVAEVHHSNHCSVNNYICSAYTKCVYIAQKHLEDIYIYFLLLKDCIPLFINQHKLDPVLAFYHLFIYQALYHYTLLKCIQKMKNAPTVHFGDFSHTVFF